MIDAASVAHRTLRYLTAPAVVGFEEPFVDLLHDELATLGRRVERHPSLLVAVGGPAVISVHIDRHGFVPREQGRLGHAASALAGRLPAPSLAAAICRRSVGEIVYAYDSAPGDSLAEATISHSDHCGRGAGLDVVAHEFTDVAPGTPVAFKSAGTMTGGWLRGQIDNTICVALAMELIEHGFDATVIFTLGEEAGRSWRALASWFGEPTSRLIVLDTSPFDNPEPATSGVVVLRGADAGATFDMNATGRLAEAADGAGVRVVWKDRYLADAGRSLGRTELGRVVAETGGRVTGSTLQVPTTDYHTNHEATTLTAIQSVAEVLTRSADSPD
ncbi:hypothetical protein [Ilumatobacter sp.]|uniref:hypothetical protein n=1 Tax=Ilumatobacter sp. TaxID=1967498 RepID=UPI003752FEDF